MNPGKFFVKLYVASFCVFLTAFGVALIIWRDLTVQIGLALGYGLGILPFASWHLVVKVTEGFTRKDRTSLAVAIGLGKYVVLGVVTYLLIRYQMVDLFALVAGTGLVLPLLVVLGALRAKEFSK